LTRSCPKCGLELPAEARFCARCGAPQPSPALAVRPWVLGAFGVGVTVTAVGALLYGVLVVDPTPVPNSTMDAATLRLAAAAIALALVALCGLQVAAFIGLVLDREWGRVAATIACVVWCLTCIGLPVSVLVLNSIWRRKPAQTGLA
jgi:hypothetical protein